RSLASLIQMAQASLTSSILAALASVPQVPQRPLLWLGLTHRPHHSSRSRRQQVTVSSQSSRPVRSTHLQPPPQRLQTASISTTVVLRLMECVWGVGVEHLNLQEDIRRLAIRVILWALAPQPQLRHLPSKARRDKL